MILLKLIASPNNKIRMEWLHSCDAEMDNQFSFVRLISRKTQYIYKDFKGLLCFYKCSLFTNEQTKPQDAFKHQQQEVHVSQEF